jgi:hypothetical protein
MHRRLIAGPHRCGPDAAQQIAGECQNGDDEEGGTGHSISR